jgi:hypothetical protein
MKSAIVVLLIVLVAAGLWWLFHDRQPPREVEIRFLTGSPAPDFARLDSEAPLTVAQAEALTPARMTDFSQEQVDQIYGRLTAGPIPDGPYDGTLFFPRGTDGDTRLAELLAGRLKGRLANLGVKKTEFLGRTLWKGKVFYRQERLLRNRIEDLRVLAPITGGTTEGIAKITVGGRDQFLLFPARLYCGQSLLDGRRESVIIDYAFTDELPGYREKPDALAGRNGLRIRDEIRMVRPGFYLGRAYLNHVFGVNFTLYNQEAAAAGAPAFRQGATPQDCSVGTQVVTR